MKNYFIKQLHVCFAVIFILTVHTTAFCQTTVIHGLPPAAQEAIDKGIIAAKIPDYPLAISYFEEARKIAPQSAEVFFNLGLAESKIPGRELRAICWFGAYLNASPAATNAAAVKEQLIELDVKNKSNLSRFLNTIQDAAIEVSKRDDDNSEDDPYYSGDDIYDLVGLWLDIGDIAMAQKTWDLIDKKGVFYKSLGQKSICDAQLDAGDIEGAQNGLDKIPLAEFKTKALVGIAEAQLKSGDTTRAKKTLIAALKTAGRIEKESHGGIGDNKKKPYALSEISYTQAMAGDISGAYKTAELIEEGESKSYAYLGIVISQTKNGDIIAAEKTAVLIMSSYCGGKGDCKINAKVNIAKAQIRASDIKGAQKTLTDVLEALDLLPDDDDGNTKSKTYSVIVEALAEIGDSITIKKVLASAIAHANSFKDKWRKTIAEVNIAEAQIKISDLKGAQNTLLAARLASDHIQDKYGIYKNDAYRAIFEVQKKGGVNLINPSDWVKKLDDNVEENDCSLNTPYFLDFGYYLKSLGRSETSFEVFRGLIKSAEKIVKARSIVMQLLKIQMGK